ncbi:hypothetical protein NC652_013955 [Populus alba x Populus x berolinensis]|uniref:Uncharacterized protein n=1 Tax=Populus alba x Populus x berolinensis TaxID=444605 RepID=A0AAD6QVK7_9ROSI|nr:hypothetical protein NC652_013955 [Populus alba x Populus x berolinensis]KAJ6997499.1 hypothetical protein NC653_013922 [Populus alba x Populus x berolinensis]
MRFTSHKAAKDTPVVFSPLSYDRFSVTLDQTQPFSFDFREEALSDSDECPFYEEEPNFPFITIGTRFHLKQA